MKDDKIDTPISLQESSIFSSRIIKPILKCSLLQMIFYTAKFVALSLILEEYIIVQTWLFPWLDRSRKLK